MAVLPNYQIIPLCSSDSVHWITGEEEMIELCQLLRGGEQLTVVADGGAACQKNGFVTNKWSSSNKRSA